jgi:hypothetical protein
MRSAVLPRILGGLTAAYGIYTVMHPQSLARAAGVVPSDSRGARNARNIGWAVGGRDIASGMSMLLAPRGAPLRTAVSARVACDFGDAVGLGLWASPRSRAKVISVAVGWGVLCAASYFPAGPSR